MWRWPLVLLAAAKLAIAAETSSGPTSDSESELIWKEAQTAYEARDFVQASNHLQRLVDRYPGAQGYLKAHLYLGVARLEMKQAERAVEPLKYFIQAEGKTPDGVYARLELGRAYHALSKKHEALLVAMELDRLTQVKSLSARRAEALVFKARTLMALGRDSEARLALDASTKRAREASAAAPVRGLNAVAELEWKLRECSKLPGKDPLKEDQLRDRISRRGQCLVESVNLYRSTVDAGDAPSAQVAAEESADAWIRYLDSCSNPLPPPGRKSKAQLNAYREELRSALLQDCKSRVNHAHQLLTEWKPKQAPSFHPPTDYLIRALERVKEAAK
jgi:hypothetical protein